MNRQPMKSYFASVSVAVLHADGCSQSAFRVIEAKDIAVSSAGRRLGDSNVEQPTSGISKASTAANATVAARSATVLLRAGA